MHDEPRPRPMISIWFFVGATFVFSWSALFTDETALRIAAIAVGMALVVVGGVFLGREVGDRKGRDRDTDRPSTRG